MTDQNVGILSEIPDAVLEEFFIQELCRTGKGSSLRRVSIEFEQMARKIWGVFRAMFF